MWASLTGIGGLAASYAMLMATRLGVGIGEAVCAPAAISWIGDLVPAERRARALAGFMMAVPVGGMLSFAIGGPVAQAFGWRVALALAALPAVALVPAVLWLKEPARGPGARGRGPGGALRALTSIPALWWIAASGAIANFVLYTFSTFLPAFLTRFHGLSVAQAGLWTGIGSGTAGILGCVAAGVYGDRIMRARSNGRLLLAAAAAPLAFAAIQDIAAPGLRGTVMALYFMAMYLCGASFGPLVTGGLSDRFAREAAGSGAVTEAARAIGLHQAMYVIPALSVALAATLGAGARAWPLPHAAAPDRLYGATIATPSPAAAFLRSASSVARGKPSRCANSRYAASYTDNRWVRASRRIAPSSGARSIRIRSRERLSRKAAVPDSAIRRLRSFTTRVFRTSNHHRQGTTASSERI